MNTFDNMESINARAWDEETPATNPPGHAPNSLPKYMELSKEEHQAAIRPIPAKKVEPEKNAANSGSPRKAGRLDPPAGKYRRLRQQPGQVVKERTGKLIEWSKENAINTKRMQDHLDKEAEKAARSIEFLGLPSQDDFPATGYFFWSESSIDPSSLLGEDLQLLDDVRTVSEVYIDILQAISCIRLRGKSQSNIESGIAGIKTKIRHAKADATGLAPLYIVEPPLARTMRSELLAEFQDDQQLESQPIIRRVVTSGPALTPKELAAWEVEIQNIVRKNRDRVSSYTLKALAEFRALNSPVRMRVHLGNIQLLYYKKELKDGSFSFQKFTAMMEESRTKANFEKSINNASFTDKILDRLKDASDIFEPIDSITSCLADIKPNHSLVILARGPSRHQVRVEADIDVVQGAFHKDFQRARDAGWQIGAVRYYQYNTHKVRLTVGSIGLERNFDWCLQITTDNVLTKPSKALQNLVIDSLSGTATDPSGVDYPSVRLHVPQGIIVDKVWIRSVLQYKLKGTSYVAEVAIYRGWDNGNTKQAPVTNFGITFYNKDWDLLMVPDEDFQGGTVWDAKSLFPDESGEEDGFSQFLAHVHLVKSFFDRD